MGKGKKRVLLIYSVCLCTFMFLGSAWAAEITLKVTSGWVKSYHQNVALLHFMDLVNKKSDKVKIVWAGGPEFIKAPEQIEAVRRGLIDMTNLSVNYIIGTFPEGTVLEMSLPLGSVTAKTEYKKFNNGVIQELDKIAQRKLGVKILGYTSPYFPFYVWLKRESFNTISGLKGLKIRAHGGAPNVFVKTLGFSPVRIASGEVYLALKTGVIDGALRSPEALLLTNEWELVKSGIDFPVGIRGGSVLFMNLKKWNSLPSDVRNLFVQCMDETEKWGSYVYTPQAEKESWEFLSAKGIKLYPVPEKEKQELIGRVEKALEEWYIEQCGETGKMLLELFKRS